MAIATKFFPRGVLVALALPLAAQAALPDLCVLAPAIEPANPQAIPTALSPLSRPTLFVREPLAELRIERGSTLLWSWSSRAGEPLEGPLAWPLPPLQPGQTLTVRLRPADAPPDQFATIQLVGAPARRLREGDRLFQSLLSRPGAWSAAIDGLLEKGDRSLATALLFAHEGPSDPNLNALRLLVAQRSCP